ncbi:hypothetical protein MKX01_026645, partial [Papaver californicum]
IPLLRFRERGCRDPYGVLLNCKFSDGAQNPCSWFGVKCYNDDKVISLSEKKQQDDAKKEIVINIQMKEVMESAEFQLLTKEV